MVTALALAGSAAAATLPLKAKCGMELSGRNTYVLQGNLGPCSTNGITIKSPGSAPALVLDLNGYTISGVPLVPDGSDQDKLPDGGVGEGAGIRVIGSNKVIVTSSRPGATVRDFDAGVLLAAGKSGKTSRPTTNSTVEKLTVTENAGNTSGLGSGAADPLMEFSDGIVLAGATNNLISNNTAIGNRNGGIRLQDAKDNRIEANTANDNLCAGIRFRIRNTGNVVVGNTSEANTHGVHFETDDPAGFPNPDNTVSNNSLRFNRALGVLTGYGSIRTVIHNNEIEENLGAGVHLAGGESTVTDNTLLDNGRGENGTGRGDGIIVASGTDNFPRVGNTVTGNAVTGSGGNGIRISCMQDQDPENFAIYGCLVFDTHNVVSNNAVTGNAVNGPSGAQTIAGGQVTGWYDLLDSTNTLATQSPFDPSDQPLTNCSNNTWSNNTFTTAFPACTTG